MASKHTHKTTLQIGEDTVLLKVAFTYIAGCRETPPTYSHGGLPADPAEVEITSLEWSRDNPRTKTVEWHKIEGPLFDFIAEDECLLASLEETAIEDLTDEDAA